MPRRYLIFLLFVPAYFLSNFFRSANAVIADDLVRDLSLSPEQLGAMSGVFFVSFALVQFPLGWALDRFGARLTTGGLLLSSVLGCLLFASAQTYAVLALGRVFIGLGVAGALMGSLKTFSRAFTPQEFPAVSGVFVALGALGLVAATAPLEFLSNTLGWRQIFVGGALASLAASLLILLFAGQAKQIASDARGSALDVLRNRAFWQIAFVNLCMGGSFYAYQGLWLGPYLTDGQGLGSSTASTLLLFASGASILGFTLSGPVANRFGVVRTLTLGSSVFFATQLALAFYDGDPTPLTFLLVLFGFSGGFNIVVFSHLRNLFDVSLTGRAFAYANFFGFVGVASFQWGLGLIVGRFEPVASAYAPQAFQVILLLTGILGLLSVALYAPLLVKAKKPG